jgi:DNA repair exonuclease SbcCD ATPase subunit
MRVGDDLSGGLIPQDVLDAHSLKPAPYFRLLAINEEMAAAARVGDTGRVRRLKSERQYLESVLEQENAARLAAVNARQISPPAKGEEAGLDKRAKRLEAEISRLQTRREKLLARSSEDPENETLLDKIDSLKLELPQLEGELEEIAARQEEIGRWRGEEERRQDLAAEQAEWERNAPAHRKRLAIVVRKVIQSWKALDAGVRELDELREKLSPPSAPHADPLKKVYEDIREATAGFVDYNGARWTVRTSQSER